MALRGTTARAARSSGVQWDADVNEFAVADDAGPEASAAVAAEEDAASVYSRTTIAGDSIVDYDSDGLDATADYDHPTGQPGIQASVRGTRGQEREPAPREKTAVAAKNPNAEEEEGREEPKHIGNICWMCCHYGSDPKQTAMRERVHQNMKTSPATIIGIAECTLMQERVLRSPFQSASSAVAGEMESRHGCQFLTIRGCEENTLCVGLRASIGSRLDLKHWERRFDGTYTSKGKLNRAY